MHYVRPNDTSSCPDEPCLTLQQYTEQEIGFTSDSTIVFLSGNHHLQATVNLTGISDVVLKGDEKFNVNISCEIEIGILCDAVTNITIYGLSFVNKIKEMPMTVFKFVNSNEIIIYATVFQGMEQSIAQPLYIENSSITIDNCHFERNFDGAIYALAESNLTLQNVAFTSNQRNDKGGAIIAENCILVIIGNTFIENLVHFNKSQRTNGFGGAIYVYNSSLNMRGSNKFLNNSAKKGGAIYSEVSTFSSSGFLFLYNNGEGALYFNKSDGEITGNMNVTMNFGGGMSFLSSNFSIMANTDFLGDVAFFGGAISALRHSHLRLGGNIQFANNSAASGGAVYIHTSTLTISGIAAFSNNNASNMGGAVGLFDESNATFSGKKILFQENFAPLGGGICVSNSGVVATAALFVGNMAEKGGGIVISKSSQESKLISANFTGNSAMECGGAVYIEKSRSVYFKRAVVVRNYGSALCIENGEVLFDGTTYISENTGRLGGGVIVKSKNLVSFIGYTIFLKNRAFIGGALYTFVGSALVFSGFTKFESNNAKTNGGAICALGSNITFWYPPGLGSDIITFTGNSAENGGAIYLGSVSFLTFATGFQLSSSQNRAFKYGGFIYNEDVPTPIQCNYEDGTETSSLPFCFFDVPTDCAPCQTLQSQNDSSQINGDIIYGGLMDRCQLYQTSLRLNVPLYTWIGKAFRIKNHYAVTSQPYQLCFCDHNHHHDCSRTMNISTQRGERFMVSLVALDQLRKPTSTQINAAITHQTGKLSLNQSIQTLSESCSNLSYAIYSEGSNEELIIYPNGPCRDTGLAKIIVNVSLQPCPEGFVQSYEECICERRLSEYNVACVIDEDIYIVKGSNSNFWMNATYINNTYQGLILLGTCPIGYCKNSAINLTLETPDRQCANYRAGVLCGACRSNYSFMLGSSKCGKCSHTYLVLILPFAMAGIVLVAFLSVLRLTVASGVANSVVLYANIVQVNKHIFLPPDNQANILTVFIAWINLDLGIETCFYNGMTAHAQVLLQFVFPVYIWVLMSVIIITSRYSITISKLIGHDPIAVLATLLLMSYTKVLKVYIDVYSYASLSYPNSSTVSVWLKDGNMPFLQSWHLFLVAVTSLFLFALFLPYTLLLLMGYKLYSCSNRKFLHWIYTLKPFLDSYYAPYKKRSRFWTGFLLLIRCALYLSFSFHQRTISSLALIITFSALVLLGWSLKWLYGKLYVVVMEFSIYFNIVALSVATLVHINSAPLVYSLIGVVFFTTISTVVYHFHILYLSKSFVWLKIVERISSFKKPPSSLRNTPTDAPTDTSSHGQHRIVATTVIDLREPLLED